MASPNADFLIINNVRMPIPAPRMTIDSAIGVYAGRNANNQVVGQVVGRRQYKINNLSWRGLTEEQIKMINPKEDYQITVSKFKKFLDKAMDYVNNGTLEFITLDELYARYYPNDAKNLEKRRTLKMIDYMEKEHEAVEEEITNFKTAILSSTDFDDLKSKFQIE